MSAAFATPVSLSDPADATFPGLEAGELSRPAAGIPLLVAGLRRGEEGAVRELHERCHARLTRYALGVCRGDEAAAAEAVQNTFLKAIRSLRSVGDEDALWAWLARACRSSAMDQHRRSRRYLAVLGRFAALFSAPDPAPPEDTESIWLTALAAALKTLPAEDRTLIEERYTERRPLAEIAHVLQTTERAVEGRLARLREKLRRSILRQLADQHHEP